MASEHADPTGFDSDEDEPQPEVVTTTEQHNDEGDNTSSINSNGAGLNDQDEQERAVNKPLNAFARGFGSAFAGRALLSVIIGLVRRRSLRKTLGVIAAPEVFRQAAFLGGYAGVYAAVLKWAKVKMKYSPQGYGEALAGAIAGTTILIDDPNRANALALYMLSRSSALFSMTQVRSGMLPNIPHFPAWVFALCEIPIMTGFMFHPNYVDPDYNNLIFKWSRDMNGNQIETVIRKGVNSEHFLSCEEVGFHPGPCAPYLMDDFVRNWWITTKMYIPLYCIPRLTFSLKRTLKDPTETLKATAKDIFYSGMMLATYIFMMKGTLCAYRHATQHKQGGMTKMVGVIGGLMTGTGVLWEASSRQKELSIYVVPQALTIVWNALRAQGLARKIPGSNALIFSLAMSGIMYHLKQHRSDVKPFIRGPIEAVIYGKEKPKSKLQ